MVLRRRLIHSSLRFLLFSLLLPLRCSCSCRRQPVGAEEERSTLPLLLPSQTSTTTTPLPSLLRVPPSAGLLLCSPPSPEMPLQPPLSRPPAMVPFLPPLQPPALPPTLKPTLPPSPTAEAPLEQPPAALPAPVPGASAPSTSLPPLPALPPEPALPPSVSPPQQEIPPSYPPLLPTPTPPPRPAITPSSAPPSDSPSEPPMPSSSPPLLPPSASPPQIAAPESSPPSSQSPPQPEILPPSLPLLPPPASPPQIAVPPSPEAPSQPTESPPFPPLLPPSTSPRPSLAPLSPQSPNSPMPPPPLLPPSTSPPRPSIPPWSPPSQPVTPPPSRWLIPPSASPTTPPSYPPLVPPPESPPVLPPSEPPSPIPSSSPPSLPPAQPITPSPPLQTVEYIDPTFPPVLLSHAPKCSLPVLHLAFGGANAVGASPVVANYTPPVDCPMPWSRVVLEFSAFTSNLKDDPISAIWLHGAELLRTTAPLPMAPGVLWRVHKDVTRYMALLRDGGHLSVTLDNLNVTLSGFFTANISLLFYRNVPCRTCMGITSNPFEAKPKRVHLPTITTIYDEPADTIIPISRSSEGSWFQLQNESDVQRKSDVIIPKNTYRAMLEIYASHHGGDGYWYLNPLCSEELQFNSYDGLESARRNGGFRQVVAEIDDRSVGSFVPFPVIYPSSISPYLWAPVAGIGAYNHPTYELEITPFLGLLLDDKAHEFGLTVRDGQPYWLLSANLHLWVDARSDAVTGGLQHYEVPPLQLNKEVEWKSKGGQSQIEGETQIKFSGWVCSSYGNITTAVEQKFKFKSKVEIKDQGVAKHVEMESKSRTSIRIDMGDEQIERASMESEAPLQMTRTNSVGAVGSMLRMIKLEHALQETRRVTRGGVKAMSTIGDWQEAQGSTVVNNGTTLWGSGDTKSRYKFRDENGCYLRSVAAVGGKVKRNLKSKSCSMVAAPASRCKLTTMQCNA